MKSKSNEPLEKMNFMHEVLLDVSSKAKKLSDNWKEMKKIFKDLEDLKRDPIANKEKIKIIEAALEPIRSDYIEAQKKIAQYKAVKQYFQYEYYGDIFKDENDLLSDILDVERRLKDYYLYIPAELDRISRDLIDIIKTKDEIYSTLQANKPSLTPGSPRGSKISNPVYDMYLQLEKQHALHINHMEERNKRTEELTKQQEIFRCILLRVLEPVDQEIIEMWCKGVAWYDIGESVGYSSKQCNRRKDNAILILIHEFKKCP